MFFYNGVFPFVADARFVFNVALTIMFFYKNMMVKATLKTNLASATNGKTPL
jgi:hypothetical protein